WDENALQSSLHESIESSSRPLNHVIAAPLRVSSKSLHFVAPCAWVLGIRASRILRVKGVRPG
ncbi:hypothetical protein A2U01_0061331, partial [Trifolium medium]|nr:hypothetical protein [Trifolium medium]